MTKTWICDLWWSHGPREEITLTNINIRCLFTPSVCRLKSALWSMWYHNSNTHTHTHRLWNIRRMGEAVWRKRRERRRSGLFHLSEGEWSRVLLSVCHVSSSPSSPSPFPPHCLQTLLLTLSPYLTSIFILLNATTMFLFHLVGIDVEVLICR